MKVFKYRPSEIKSFFSPLYIYLAPPLGGVDRASEKLFLEKRHGNKRLNTPYSEISMELVISHARGSRTLIIHRVEGK